eukprot:gb/GFBE01072320.1/.p1 GENE.gb/GFBE01072320.1/~~gb/GFBE01072320.1/.p1  ORF type:complete len:456 (+),score=118.07 gb/GFBE01072320.1/:1-1368(+)
MSMHTTQEWMQHAQYNMYQAQHSHRKAEGQHDRSRRAHNEVMSENLSMYNELHTSLEQKVKTSQRLLDKLMHRAESVENSLQHTKQSLAKLEEALAAKEAPLALCMWRMEQRERRPLREQVRDAVEVSLEVEKATLIDAQRRLKDAIRKTRATIQVLESKLDELRHDISQKSQALSVDEMCLRTTHRSFETVADRTAQARSHSSHSRNAPPSAGSRRTTRHDVAVHESSRNEVQRQQEAVKLNQSAVQREEAAKELREESQKLVIRCARAAEEAGAKSDKAMKERINDNQGMRRRLESELRETCNQITLTKNTIQDTKQQIRSLEEPMELCSTCASWRKQRATKEHILDPVTTTLQEHQMTLLRSHEELRSHHQNEKGILQELQEKRERLKEDLRDKTSALHIDLNCLTHEATQLNGKPSKAISKNRLPRAMKVDPNFIPSPGHTMMVQMPLTAR